MREDKETISHPGIDPVTAEAIGSFFMAVVEEMGTPDAI